jgi:hypothetical protein
LISTGLVRRPKIPEAVLPTASLFSVPRLAACLLADRPEAARRFKGFDVLIAFAAAPISTGSRDELPGGNCNR